MLSRPHDGLSLPLAPAELTPDGLLSSLHARGIPFIGGRSPEEIVKRLAGKGRRRKRDAVIPGYGPADRELPAYRGRDTGRFRRDRGPFRRRRKLSWAATLPKPGRFSRG